MNLAKINNKIKDHMLIGSVYDNIIKKVKYNDKPLDFLYNVMVGQKHRMLYYKIFKPMHKISWMGSKREKEEQQHNMALLASGHEWSTNSCKAVLWIGKESVPW